MLIRTTALAASVTTLGIVAIGPTSASDQRPVATNAAGIEVVGSDLNARFIPLGIGKSVVIDLPRDIKDVLIADPKIANAVVRSARRAYIIGAAVGQTNIFFFDAEGHQIGGFDIAVKRDLNGIRNAIKQALPASDIQVEGVGDGDDLGRREFRAQEFHGHRGRTGDQEPRATDSSPVSGIGRVPGAFACVTAASLRAV
jgi:pilus assembly protein CpaC